eukprot:Pgem_evm1s5579
MVEPAFSRAVTTRSFADNLTSVLSNISIIITMSSTPTPKAMNIINNENIPNLICSKRLKQMESVIEPIITHMPPHPRANLL